VIDIYVSKRASRELPGNRRRTWPTINTSCNEQHQPLGRRALAIFARDWRALAGKTYLFLDTQQRDDLGCNYREPSAAG